MTREQLMKMEKEKAIGFLFDEINNLKEKLALNEPSVPPRISTLQNCVKTCPQFPLGEVCGKLERYPIKEGDYEGGMRTQGIYKRDTAELPLITYITVVRNGATTIQRCMESVFEQCYPNIEYIIIDGASNDGTMEAVLTHECNIDYFISQPDNGTSDAINKGIALASGKIISFIFCDDILTQGTAQTVIDHYNETKADVFFGRLDFTPESKIEASAKYGWHIFYYEKTFMIPYLTVIPNQMHMPALYCTRSTFENVGAYNESYIVINDYEWSQKCIEQNLNICFIDKTLTLFELGGISSGNMKTRILEAIRLTQEKFPFLTEAQASLYYFGVHGYGLRSLGYVNVFNKFNNLIKREKYFRVAMYRIVLYTCILDCYSFMNNDTVYNKKLISLCQWMENKLSDHIALGEEGDATDDDLYELVKARVYCQSCYFKYNITTASLRGKVKLLILKCISIVIKRNTKLYLFSMKLMMKKFK
ncbi:MAG: glycosyltransferase [Defluviitaleaceae bacterium]|nr:glycosyltransferase [Defluviitaleaceae bacterium]MCL2238336.1 glycosyltransferase [Defluviitaleaceae bacterium]